MASTSRPPRVQVRTTQPDSSGKDSSDWKEETSMSTGKKYYYNKRTKMASWAKPYELMTPTERLIAPTNWIEAVAASNGKMFYFNTVTQESMWSTPDEVKRVNVAATDWREEHSREGKRYWYNTVTQVSQWATPAEVKLARARANMNPSDVQAQMEDAEELARERANLDLACERANLDLNLPAPMEDNVELAREVGILNDAPAPAQAPAEGGAEKAGELAEAVENLSVEAPLPPKKKRAWRLMDEE